MADSPTSATQASITSGPDFVSLQVRDLDAAATFYEDTVGLRRLPATNPDAVVFATTETAFAVRRPVADVDLDAYQQLGAGVGIWFAASDAQGLHDRLKDRDVDIVQAPSPSPFGLQFAFRDLDGYVVTIHQGA